MQDVIAAITTSPWPRSWLRPSTVTRLLPPGLLKSRSSDVASDGCRSKISLLPSPLPLLNSLSIDGDEARLDLLQRDAILRTLRAGERRLDAAEFELEHVGEDRIGRGLGADTCPAPWHRPRPDRCAPVRARCRSDTRWCRRRSGRSRRSRRIPAPCCRCVARSAIVRPARPGPKNSTNLPTTPRLRSICVTVSTRSVAVMPSLSLPVSLTPITSGSTIE